MFGETIHQLFLMDLFLTGYAICYIWNVIPDTEDKNGKTIMKRIEEWLDAPMTGAELMVTSPRRLPKITDLNYSPTTRIL